MTEARRQYMKRWRAKNRDKTRRHKLKWVQKAREHINSYSKAWCKKNRPRCNQYQENWRKRNQWRLLSYGLKRLSTRPGESLFPTFASLDRYPGYESGIMIDRITPLDELIMKEEGLL